MVTLSRKRRWMRVLMVRRNHVAAAETASATAAAYTSVMFDCCTPSPSSLSHKASKASGKAASSESPNARLISRGSC